MLGNFPGNTTKLFRLRQSFNIKTNDFGSIARCQVFHAIRHIDVGLITHTESLAESQSKLVQMIEHLGNKTATLRHHTDKALHRSIVMEKRGIEPMGRIYDSDAVRSNESDPKLFCNSEQLFFQTLSLFTGFPESTGNNDGASDSLFSALSHHLSNNPGRHDYKGEIRYCRNFQHIPICFKAQHFF